MQFLRGANSAARSILPTRRCSVQAEVNRALYLDEETVALTADAAQLEAEIDHLTSVLLERAG